MRIAPTFLLAALILSGCASPIEGAADGPPSQGAVQGCPFGVAGLDLDVADIPALQTAMMDGRLTSVALTQAYIDRIEAFAQGPFITNAVRQIHPDALVQAATLDAEREAGKVRGPLHGMPILLKDNIGTNDQATTAGSIALAANVPPYDSTLAANLRAAGAVILGKANLSEFANWVDLSMPNGYSSLGGQVVNAYTGGDPSGSSSGSGVAGSMAFAAGTFGSETSGSILSPSNANSLVGVKPTTGLISRTGIIPLAVSFDTAGPMVRNVVDAALLLDAVAGSHPADSRTVEADSHIPAAGYAAGLSLHALDGVRVGFRPSSNELFAAALDTLSSLGAILVEVDDSDLNFVSVLELPLIFNEFKAGINAYLATIAGPGLPVSDLTDIILYNNDHPDEVRYGQNLLIASNAQVGSQLIGDAAALPVITAARLAADDTFTATGVDVIVGLNAPYTSLGAAAGYPTVVVPAGYEGQTPRGLSFFGPAWSEAALLAYAYAYEQASMMRQPPAAINPEVATAVCGAEALGPTAGLTEERPRERSS